MRLSRSHILDTPVGVSCLKDLLQSHVSLSSDELVSEPPSIFRSLMFYSRQILQISTTSHRPKQYTHVLDLPVMRSRLVGDQLMCFYELNHFWFYSYSQHWWFPDKNLNHRSLVLFSLLSFFFPQSAVAKQNSFSSLGGLDETPILFHLQ